MRTIIIALVAGGLSLSLPANALWAADFKSRPRVRTHDDRFVSVHAAPSAIPQLQAGAAEPLRCDLQTRVTHAQAAPHGGTFSLGAFFNPANIDISGRIAFLSQVAGHAQNQGYFTADSASGLAAVVLGCGPLGGDTAPPGTCGTPSPLGGTFSGFFLGTVFSPDINDNGDVLFFADLANATSSRGLFLRDGATGTYHTVAAVGMPSPLGGTFTEVGPGSLNNHGEVVFLARSSAALGANVFKWVGGVTTKVVAVGDPAPGGGTFNQIGTESFGFADGTSIPIGPVPDINDAGQICFRGEVVGGNALQGLFVITNGTMEWYVEHLAPAPGGGNFAGVQGGILNEVGDVAFFADVNLGGGQFTSAWFAGRPGTFRRALAFFDPVGEGECFGLAFSRNPMQPIDVHGNVLLWTVIRMPDLQEFDALVLNRADGANFVVAIKGEAAPHGGTIGSMDAWPSLNDNNQGTLSAATPGAPGGALSAHMVFDLCVTGDLNGDLMLSEQDRAVLCAALGSSKGDAEYVAAADLNGDDVIDELDQALFNDILPPCAGDIVTSATFQPPADGVTDAADLAYLLGAWANQPSCADFVSSKTFQPPPDGAVDGADLAYLLGAWGQCD
jgi:hypothetical protein